MIGEGPGNPINAGGAWDILPLDALARERNFGKLANAGGKQGTGPLLQTVQFRRSLYVDLGIYYAHAVNYSMWGYINKLCYDKFNMINVNGDPNDTRWELDTALTLVTVFKAKYLWSGVKGAKEFTKFGYAHSYNPEKAAITGGYATDPSNKTKPTPGFDFLWLRLNDVP